jgi:hypothetical protein
MGANLGVPDHDVCSAAGQGSTGNSLAATPRQKPESVTAWAELDGLTRAEPLELCHESVARTVPSEYNPTRRETSNKEIQLLLCHVH